MLQPFDPKMTGECPIPKRLAASLTHLRPSPGMGLCFHWSVSLLLDWPSAKLAIGTVAGSGDLILPQPMLHAWVERRGAVYSPSVTSDCGRLFPLDRVSYYVDNGVSDVHSVSRCDVKRFVKIGRVEAHLMGNVPHGLGKPFVPALLDHLGIPFSVCGDGIVPAMSEIDQPRCAEVTR